MPPAVRDQPALAPPRGDGQHTLLVADSNRLRRAGAAAWVDRELATGSKVFYKGWGDAVRPDQHWLAGPDGSRRARAAFDSGQLEFLDFPTVIERCGGTSTGYRDYQFAEVERAYDEGWPGVALSQESAGRPMADDAEAGEFASQESVYDALLSRWPLAVLCQLTVPDENEAAVWESAVVHHRDIVDGPWSVGVSDGFWAPRGDVDAHVARRFGAALHGALRDVPPDGGPLRIDLAEVTFMDVTCVQMLLLAVRSAPDDRPVVLHRTPTIVRRVVEALGRPRTLLFDHEVPV